MNKFLILLLFVLTSLSVAEIAQEISDKSEIVPIDTFYFEASIVPKF